MLQLKAMFHGIHHKVLNHMISNLEIADQSNLNTLLFNQELQDNHTRIQTYSEQKEPSPKPFKNLQHQPKTLDQELKILMQDQMF